MKNVYYIEFESKYWHGASDMHTTVVAETEDEARYLVEPKIAALLHAIGYENDPGHITKVDCLD